MENQIINAQLKFNCCASWDDMSKSGNGRNCHYCQKRVYDFTNSTQNDLDLILAENNYNICGRFNATQLTPKSIDTSFWRKWISAAMVFIGFNLINAKAIAQIGKILVKQEELTPAPIDFPLGKVILLIDKLPQFPGGIAALNEFLEKNIEFKGTSGKVIVGFDIDSSGKIWNPRILRGLDSISNKEALRVVGLSPKWEPATYKGKPTKITFTLPVIFQK